MGNGMERRDFLKVLGTASAGAGLFGCSSSGPERLLPYVVPDETIVPGISTWYRTTCRECPAGCGMNIRTREGRAIKAEGNPLSPISHGKLCPRGQASLHGLYDPDRVPQPLARNGDGWDKLTWDAAEQKLAEQLAANRGRTVLLTYGETGAMDRLLEDFADAAGIERVRWETFTWEPIRAASRMLYGTDSVPVHDFSQADFVVSFGADFLETWVSPVDYAHGWVQSHAYREGHRGHFLWVGPHQSLTGMNSDEWLPVRPGTEHLVALAMARLIADGDAAAAGRAGSGAALLAQIDPTAVAEQSGITVAQLRAAADAMRTAGPRSLAVGPGVGTTHSQATAVAIAVAVLNAVAGGVGTTVSVEQRELASAAGSYQAMRALIDRMRAGQVGALLVYGPNPAYGMPQPDEIDDAFAKVPFIASFSSWLDETSARAHLLLPDHHFLESWGDYVPRTGMNSLIQPVMVPVFDTKQTGDVLLSVARRAGVALPNQANSFYDYLRGHWSRDVFPQAGATAGFEDWWREALQIGFVTTPTAGATASGTGMPNVGGAGALDLRRPAQFAGDGDMYLIVYPSIRFYDGRLANRPWLQELPDPVSKISWGSWVEVNPETAEELGLDDLSIAEVETPFGKARLPVWRHPGIRPDTIAIQLGQGHDEHGRYAQDRGVNAARLIGNVIEPASGGLVWAQTKASIRATGEWEKVAHTGHTTEYDRHVARTITMQEARTNDREFAAMIAAGAGGPTIEQEHPSITGHGDLGTAGALAGRPQDKQAHGADHDDLPFHLKSPHHRPVVPPQTEEVRELQVLGGFGPVDVPAGPGEYPPPGVYYGEYSEAQPRWGMSIDMERCIGCSACMTACYAENNIAIVGPDQIAKGRLMQWIRIERYYDDDEHTAHGGARFLPMLCQHCGNAPCEPVCPVYAAYHTPDGLNAQIYNRCVGTRYCLNNCPYKVRYYNYFSHSWPEPLNWQLNPDVVVREKGVMEKCTFCVQRIRETQQHARLENRTVGDGEIVPACAQTCPGEAIVFGNLKDPNSRVSRVAASGRGYRVLDELNTQSGIVYLKKVAMGSAEAH